MFYLLIPNLQKFMIILAASFFTEADHFLAIGLWVEGAVRFPLLYVAFLRSTEDRDGLQLTPTKMTVHRHSGSTEENQNG